MAATWDDAWGWLKTAPLPVVLALNIAVVVWVWNLSNRQVTAEVLASDAKIAAEKSEMHTKAADDRHDQKLDSLAEKMDKLFEAVVELKAEQRAGEARRQRADPAPATTTIIVPSSQPAEKAKKKEDK